MSGSDRDKSSSGSQTQNCAKCLNHGKAIPVRNHYCPFKYCLCDKCVILSRQARRESSRDPVVQYRDEQIMVEPMFDSSDEVPVAEFAGLQQILEDQKKEDVIFLKWRTGRSQFCQFPLNEHEKHNNATRCTADDEYLS
ncbi:doublesex- and mab-3-related transcription factor dmd-10-like [Xenia sp. Carnegie-2017]|uniref:doublesex- and mab-3-related transcription factor dmd-10-like n=1 Tax=Xenia sp. Carnegie-2017 TaxID=2897299 RepID=UPI001F039919|nr:doublesex- and mab-3-related transcription factor dmd-10-like [Xenia sp. Carnegie-2017]